MHIGDVEKAAHLSEELKRLKEAQIRIIDETTTTIQCIFMGEDAPGSAGVVVTVGAHDREFSRINQLAQSFVNRLAVTQDGMVGLGQSAPKTAYLEGNDNVVIISPFRL